MSDVSRETGYSYYHMTRLFTSVLGEPVDRYITRRRLYNASEQLIHSGRQVIDIALDCGFESPEGFRRAFKADFGSSPVDYRRAERDAVFTHRGTLENLSKTYQYILGTWLQTTKAELDDREDFEVYNREVLSFGDPNNEVKIYIPVK